MGGRVVQKYIEDPLLAPLSPEAPTVSAPRGTQGSRKPQRKNGVKATTMRDQGQGDDDATQGRGKGTSTKGPEGAPGRRSGVKFDLRVWMLLVGRLQSACDH